MTDPFFTWTSALGKIPSFWRHAALLCLYFCETLKTMIQSKEKQTQQH